MSDIKPIIIYSHGVFYSMLNGHNDYILTCLTDSGPNPWKVVMTFEELGLPYEQVSVWVGMVHNIP